MTQQWGDRINITDHKSQEIAKAFLEARERMAYYMISGDPYPVPEDTWRDRLVLAWRVLRGQITWRDIG